VILRRRSLPAELRGRFDAFRGLIPTLEAAKAALTASVPGTRLPGRPLAETLLDFEEGLREVREGMDSWRSPEVEEAWRGASDGLDAALGLAARVRTELPEPEGFEQLIALIGDLLAPLGAFADAADRFRELRS
jgi:hypothetical protein